MEKVRLSTELSSSVREKDPLIKLNTDGTAIFTNVPILDGFGDRVTCRLTGSAIWELHSEFNSASGWSVDFSDYQPNLKPAQHECNRENSSWGMLVLSRHAPYRLYTVVGDPDSDEGVEFKKAAS